MAVGKPSPQTDSHEPFMIEIIGVDGIVHHMGPFATREAAESWMAHNAPSQGDQQQSQNRKTESSGR